MMGRYHLSDDAHPEDLMRPVAFLFFAAVMLSACDTATAPRSMHSSVDDSRVPAELRAAYLEDANRLALRDLLANGFSEVPIPQDAVQPYYNALVGVYNATALPARDTVVDVYRIRTSGNPTTRSLLLQLVGTEPWAQHLARREIPTGGYCTQLPCGSGFGLSTTTRWSRLATVVATSYTNCATCASLS